MPTDQGSVKKAKQRLSIQRMRDNEAAGRQRGSDTGDSILPQAFHTRLFKLFGQIEHEFEGMYAESLQCKTDLCFVWGCHLSPQMLTLK